jgi:dynactin complex subunit
MPGKPRRFAQIAFVGPTHFGSNPGKECWVGVVYEEKVGKNDGALDGQR